MSKFSANDISISFSENIPSKQIENWKKHIKLYLKYKTMSTRSELFCIVGKKKNTKNFGFRNKGILQVRCLFADFGKEDVEREYVLLQGFLNYGQFSTIDIVSLPNDSHEGMAQEYLNEILTANLNKQIFFRSGPKTSRYLIGGGSLKYTLESDSLKFSSAPEVFKNQFFGINTNDLGATLTSKSRLFSKVKGGNLFLGSEYIMALMNFLIDTETNDNFYSQLVQFYFDKMRMGPFNPRDRSAILMSKVFDRYNIGGEKLKEIIFDESCRGIGKEMYKKGIERFFHPHTKVCGF